MVAHFLLGPNPLENLTDFSNILSAYIKQYFKIYKKYTTLTKLLFIFVKTFSYINSTIRRCQLKA